MIEFTVNGVPILTRVILAVPPKVNFRYSVHDKPSLKAGDQAVKNNRKIINTKCSGKDKFWQPFSSGAINWFGYWPSGSGVGD